MKGESGGWAVAPAKTWVDVRVWLMPHGDDDGAAYQAMFPTPGHRANASADMEIQSLRTITGHPMDSGNFMIEDMWVCERMQRAMSSPLYAVGPMAPYAESALTFFQRNILDYMPLTASNG